ncbi:MAG TPA: ATP-binding protein [Niabella sp.]|nr:ATP-binding protein [Candidatus Woesebacteria bacterium]HUN01677.1 ATP-binding protein [Niabella sp.]
MNIVKMFNPTTLIQLLSNDYISSHRNMQISSIFKEMGLIERYGTGIKRVRALFSDYQLPEPEFKQLQDGFWWRVKAAVAEKQNVTDNVVQTSCINKK